MYLYKKIPTPFFFSYKNENQRYLENLEYTKNLSISAVFILYLELIWWG